MSLKSILKRLKNEENEISVTDNINSLSSAEALSLASCIPREKLDSILIEYYTSVKTQIDDNNNDIPEFVDNLTRKTKTSIASLGADMICSFLVYLDMQSLLKFCRTNKYHRAQQNVMVKRIHDNCTLAIYNNHLLESISQYWSDNDYKMIILDNEMNIFASNGNIFENKLQPFPEFGGIKLCRIRISYKNAFRLLNCKRLLIAGYDHTVTSQSYPLKKILKQNNNLCVLKIYQNKNATTSNSYGGELFSFIEQNQTDLKYIQIQHKYEPMNIGTPVNFNINKLCSLKALALIDFVGTTQSIKDILSLENLQYLSIVMKLHEKVLDLHNNENDLETITIMNHLKFLHFEIVSYNSFDMYDTEDQVEKCTSYLYNSLQLTNDSSLSILSIPTNDDSESSNVTMFKNIINKIRTEQCIVLCVDRDTETDELESVINENSKITHNHFDDEVMQYMENNHFHYDMRWFLNN